MKITTIVEADGETYRADSECMEIHVDKLYGIERMIEKMAKYDCCVWCNSRHDSGDPKFCSPACAEDWYEDQEANVVAKGN